ncbi:unnamed protein product [Arctia plantaginis]|uniref:Uncharacterized protein n=1 Tax=Arctia plantaginis TaxID=874455 RepID=A0A8S1AP47_ARCPL|nr:unnamed protein product [Arctia plantaginis]
MARPGQGSILITYFRVVDRLGMGPGPIIKILKGGLQKNYISIRLRSGYNLPISVNIYVGCQNKEPRRPIRPTKPTKPTTETNDEPDSITSESAATATATLDSERATADSGEAATEDANKIEDPKDNTDDTTGAINDENADANTNPPSALKKKKKSKDNPHNTS